jgi:hypothetical protein
MSDSNAYGQNYQDAYVFVPSGSEETISKLKGLWREHVIRYAIRVLSGGFGAVAFLEAENGDDGLIDLRRKITRVRDEVNPGTSVGISLSTGPMAPTRWSRKLKIGAYVRIRAHHGHAGEVFDAVKDLKGYYGSALVLGDWDVMLELGADSFDGMKGLLGDQLQRIDGVQWTDSAIVLNDADEPAGPDDQ